MTTEQDDSQYDMIQDEIDNSNALVNYFSLHKPLILLKESEMGAWP